MRLCRFNDDRPRLVEGDQIEGAGAALEATSPARWSTPHGNLLIANLAAVCEGVKHLALAASRRPIAEGVEPVQPGDVMHCWVESIGAIDVPVRAA